MIGRSFLVFLGLCIGYALFVARVPITWDTTQHLANGNRIKAERFVYDRTGEGRTVIVGSSLAYRIVLDSLPEGTVNLGFGGLSIYDGLELIGRSGQVPERVLVETNILFREPDRQFLDALFQNGPYQLREVLPMTREQNQPSGVLFGWLKQRFLSAKAPPGTADSTEAPSAVMLSEHQARYSELPPDSTQARFMRMLGDAVAGLEEQGVEVVFFEVPIQDVLMDMPLSRLGRGLIEGSFPRHRFLRPPAGMHWHTTDGLHLQKPDARRFSGWLNEAL